VPPQHHSDHRCGFEVRGSLAAGSEGKFFRLIKARLGMHSAESSTQLPVSRDLSTRKLGSSSSLDVTKVVSSQPELADVHGTYIYAVSSAHRACMRVVTVSRLSAGFKHTVPWPEKAVVNISGSRLSEVQQI
jgi:hypothetical protein